jgi:hypothetical protein
MRITSFIPNSRNVAISILLLFFAKSVYFAKWAFLDKLAAILR